MRPHILSIEDPTSDLFNQVLTAVEELGLYWLVPNVRPPAIGERR